MSKLNADINLGAGDRSPSRQVVLTKANTEDGSPGGPENLTGATIVFRYQKRGTTDTPTELPVSIIGDPTDGLVQLDWPAPVPSGDYDCRFVATLGSGLPQSWPDGPDVDGTEFYWLHVTADFAS